MNDLFRPSERQDPIGVLNWDNAPPVVEGPVRKRDKTMNFMKKFFRYILPLGLIVLSIVLVVVMAILVGSGGTRFLLFHPMKRLLMSGLCCVWKAASPC